MADALEPTLPMPGEEPLLPEGGALPGGEPAATSGDLVAPTGPESLTPAAGETGPANDTGHKWNMDPPGSTVDVSVRDA